MLYVKDGDVLTRLEDWSQVYERPNFVTNIDLKNKKLKTLVGYYKNEPPRACSISSCHASHHKGCIVVTEDGIETCIGHICGSKLFKEKFDKLVLQLEKEVEHEIYKEAVATRKKRVFEYWQKAASLTHGANGILKLAEKINQIKDPLIVGRYASQELVRMAASKQTKVSQEEWVEKQKKELTEEEASRGEKKYKLEHVIIGQINGVEILSPVNEMSELYLDKIESVIKSLESLDLEKATKRQIQTVGRKASVLDSHIKKANELHTLATRFLTKENLTPLYQKMCPMDTVSRKDLELYEAFINKL